MPIKFELVYINECQMTHLVHIAEKTRKNNLYRNVLYTTESGDMQIVAMHLLSSESIPLEIHQDVAQMIHVMQGSIRVISQDIKGKFSEIIVKVGDLVTIDRSTYHEVMNISGKSVRLYTIYTPAEHPPGTKTKRQPLYSGII